MALCDWSSDVCSSDLSNLATDKKIIWVRNKVDMRSPQSIVESQESTVHSPQSVSVQSLNISAKNGIGIEDLKRNLTSSIINLKSSIVVTNLRHYEHLQKTNEALGSVLTGLASGITGDFLAQDIRLSLFHLGELTGTIVSDDLLANIFSKFCIGK